MGRPTTATAASVARPLAAGHDEVRRDAGPVQRDGVVEPGLEHRGRPAVVLGRAEHNDRVGGAALVEGALLPDAERREPARGRREHARHDERAHDPARDPPAQAP